MTDHDVYEKGSATSIYVSLRETLRNPAKSFAQKIYSDWTTK